MVKIKLLARESNNSNYINKDTFNINYEENKKECAYKIIDLIIQGFVCHTPVGEYGESSDADDLMTFRQFVERWVTFPDSAVSITFLRNLIPDDFQQCINQISQRLEYIHQDTIIEFVRSPGNESNSSSSNHNGPNNNGSNHNGPNMGYGSNHNDPNHNGPNNGGSYKEYVKLQKGGKRLVRYGKRGGKYYMKGGNKVYIK